MTGIVKSMVVIGAMLLAAVPASAGAVQIVESERAYAQWSGGTGCVTWFVHVLAERARVVDPPGAPPRAAVASVSVIKADSCTGAVFESSHGRAFARGIRFGPGGASLRATVPLEDAVTGTTRPVRVEVEWRATDGEAVSLIEHDQGVVRFDATSSDAVAAGHVVRDTGALAAGAADSAGLSGFRRLAAGRDV